MKQLSPPTPALQAQDSPPCFMPQVLYGVIGWPLGQSLSPLLHNTAFQALRIPAAYLAWSLAAEHLAPFIQHMALYGVRGLSVTIPHKQTIMPLLDKISPLAAQAGAVNTVYRDGEALCGDNTDITGFLAPLKSLGTPLAELPILVLGAGGAAHAAAAGLSACGCHKVWITSPGNRRQYPLAERFQFTPVLWEERQALAPRLVINATPAGMVGHNERELCYAFRPVAGNPCWAYDLVYNPLQTCFLQAASAAGWSPISGLEMFLGQGAAQFQLWTGQNLPQDAARAVRLALERGNGR